MNRFVLLCLISALVLSGCRSKKLVNDPAENARLKEMVKKYEKMLEADIDEQQAWQLYDHIDHWWGVPYLYGGKTKKGVDCSGFVQILYQNVYKKSIPRHTAEQIKVVRKVKKRKLKEGHLVFFYDENNTAKPTHVGVYLKKGRFVHASTSKGVRIDLLESDYFRKRYLIGGRVQ